MRSTIAFAIMLFGWGSMIGACLKQPGPTQAQIAAESSYTADLLLCIERSNTLAESKACRATVDARWGVASKEAGR